MTDKATLWYEYMRLVGFVASLLDPEKFGHSVPSEVRDAAREALGLKAV